MLAGNSSLAVRLIKNLLTENAAETDLTAAQARELIALREASASPEHRDAVRAFLAR